MKATQTVIGLLLTAVFSACGCTPTDMSEIKVGSERAQVEAIIGTPIKSHEIKGETVQVYEYYRDLEFMSARDVAHPMAALLVVPLSMMVGATDQKAYLAVSYSREGKIEVFAVDSEPAAALGNLDSVIKLKNDAAGGDPEARYEYSELQWRQLNHAHLDPTERKELICRLAYSGNSLAQRRMGIFHLYPQDPESPNLVGAYVWLRLAAENDGKGSGSVDAVARKLTPEQRVRAKHLVAEWEPEPGKCEEFGAKAGN